MDEDPSREFSALHSELRKLKRAYIPMIDRDTFELIKKKHGDYASWAVWTDSSGKPKDKVGDLSIFDLEKNGHVLGLLHSRFVLVGLNISRQIERERPLGNFHDKEPRAMDFKLRYALKGTPLWGSYMTDIIKDFEQKASGKTMAYLRKNKSFELDNLKMFEAELRDLGVQHPTLIAFGRDAFEILSRHFHNVWKLPHYSNYMGKEDYRKKIATAIKSNSRQPYKAAKES